MEMEIIKKLKGKNGETLIESLMALMLILFAVSILGGYGLTSDALVTKYKKDRSLFDRELSSLESLDETDLMTAEAMLTISVKEHRGRYQVIEEKPVILYYGDHMAVYEIRGD